MCLALQRKEFLVAKSLKQNQKSVSAICWRNKPSPSFQIQPQEISPPPTANLDRSNDKVYENVTGLVKAVIEMSSKIQPAPPEEYVPMVKVRSH